MIKCVGGGEVHHGPWPADVNHTYQKFISRRTVSIGHRLKYSQAETRTNNSKQYKTLNKQFLNTIILSFGFQIYLVKTIVKKIEHFSGLTIV